MAEFNGFKNVNNLNNNISSQNDSRHSNSGNTHNIRELSLGKKIRQLRIERKITQQELVGDFITRNMLSQIENDTATPSIKTLQYIADHLEVPLSFLMMGEHDDEFTGAFEYDSAEVAATKAKNIFFAGDYVKYINVIESNPHIAAENRAASMLLGFAYLAVMSEAFSNGEKDKCTDYYEKLKRINYTGNSIKTDETYENDFIDKHIKRYAELYRLLCQPVISDTSDTSDTSGMSEKDSGDYDFLKEILDENGLCRYNLLAAQKFLKNGEPQKSFEHLKEAERIIDNIESIEYSANPAANIKYPYREELYKLLETACVQLEDYKNAHLYSSKLLSLYAGRNKV
jgi:transcriptional regulator with XRE-family HTH domain